MKALQKALRSIIGTRGTPKLAFAHWYAEHHASDRDYLGPDAAVEIIITPR
jgi:hypothetical protein